MICRLLLFLILPMILILHFSYAYTNNLYFLCQFLLFYRKPHRCLPCGCKNLPIQYIPANARKQAFRQKQSFFEGKYALSAQNHKK